MQFPELEAFLDVFDHGSVSGAAERLHVTQPAISKRLQALERELGQRLFDRVGKRLLATEQGRRFATHARGLLLARDHAAMAVKAGADTVSGTLRLATSHHIGLHRLAPVLKAFNQSHAGVRLDVRFEDSEAAHELVRDGRSELAVVTLDPDGREDLDYRPIWHDPLTFVAPPNRYPKRRIAWQRLAEDPHILPTLTTYTGRLVQDAFRAEGLKLAPAMATNYLETIRMLVSAGLGWSVLPEKMLNADIAQIRTAALPQARTLGVVTNPRLTLSTAAAAFIEVIDAHRDAGS